MYGHCERLRELQGLIDELRAERDRLIEENERLSRVAVAAQTEGVRLMQLLREMREKGEKP